LHPRRFAAFTGAIMRVARRCMPCVARSTTDEIGGLVGQAQLQALLDDPEQSLTRTAVTVEAQDLFKRSSAKQLGTAGVHGGG
jgi:phytoene synthase